MAFSISCLAWFTLSLTLICRAQSSLPESFDIAAIKPSPADVAMEWSPSPGGRFSARGITFKELVAIAYGVQSFQVTGGPRWAGVDRWSIEARAETFAGRLSRDELQKPVQRLLFERFHFRGRRETREMPVYVLVPAPGGPKLKPAHESARTMGFGRGFLNAKAANLTLLSRVLATLLDRPVLDETGITGEFEIYMEWSPEPGEGASVLGPGADLPDRKLGSIFTALQEQLGLRLESRRAPADIVNIEGAARPDEN